MTKNEFFDHVAANGDPLLFTDADRRKMQDLKTRLGDLTGKRVLEPGCGTGPLTEYLSEWVGPKGHVLAFDASGGMVEVARRKLGHLKNVEIVHATAETVTLQPASWDVVLLFRVFPHFDDKPAVLRRMRGWIAPGGRLVIANLEGSARLNELHAGFSEAVRHDYMPSAHEVAGLFRDCGFGMISLIDTGEEFYAEAAPRTGEGSR